jgi:hypothetical protein
MTRLLSLSEVAERMSISVVNVAAPHKGIRLRLPTGRTVMFTEDDYRQLIDKTMFDGAGDTGIEKLCRRRWGRAVIQAGRNRLTLDEIIRLHGILIEDARFVHLGLRPEASRRPIREQLLRQPCPSCTERVRPRPGHGRLNAVFGLETDIAFLASGQ